MISFVPLPISRHKDAVTRAILKYYKSTIADNFMNYDDTFVRLLNEHYRICTTSTPTDEVMYIIYDDFKINVIKNTFNNNIYVVISELYKGTDIVKSIKEYPVFITKT